MAKARKGNYEVKDIETAVEGDVVVTAPLYAGDKVVNILCSKDAFEYGEFQDKPALAIGECYRKATKSEIMLVPSAEYFEERCDPSGGHFWRFRGKKIIAPFPTSSDRITFVDLESKETILRAIELAAKYGAKEINLVGATGVTKALLEETATKYGVTIV